ncbi:amino acid ABC transporter substrate-binding protein (plasmid) [Deinococcus metallilatus]|uniref:Amino acid ABC transporter substrate-binding protein n=1 Tax=Deinococcus metallilatus TaxID=1211322 RepID=A0AAJ5F6N7_9DEIO|nr:ABC transporter substrate-binding protein [Deinococcus metallilatus]MBB5295615.1 polar amino acid transport system substrate-binding protein [Deinococcus metallilatus]QBY06920.1 amino acid ABC transporter substrate-binding protein [Deinococcus metallilatus]TLK32310.1 amino acid ABC transporter substrate-binding protein [Deinococcus metallilatus]GMA14144.1 amino acid ABC transporter substrate-binding protein [Deinococcus metallilatus]
MNRTARASLLFSLLALGSAQARPWQEIKASGVIKIATNAEFKPFTYYEGNTMKGFEYDLGNALAKQLGVKAEWVNQPFDSLLIGLNQDRFDLVISSHGITPERQKAVDFSHPHYCSGGLIVSRIGGPKTGADLKGKTVATQIGTTYVDQIRKILGDRAVRTYPSNAAALQALQAGRVDAVVNEKFYNLAAIKANKGQLQAGDLLFQERIGMAVKKGNTSLLQAVNGALATVMKNGVYAKLSQSYFGQDVRCK